MEKKEMNKEAIAKFEALKKAWEELNEYWARFEKADLDNMESISLYPFSESFDEINVSEWCEETIEELKSL